MSKITKRVLVEFEFESATEETPYIKDWWLRNMIAKAVQDNMQYMQDNISIKVEHTTTNVLPNEVTINIEDILSNR